MTLPFARPFRATDAVVRLAIVGLTLGTGYIHFTLGGLLFTLNALGYLAGAAAMVAPIALASRFRWAVRIGLAGYAASTIIAWAIQGPFYITAYFAKAIEVALIILLTVDFLRFDGNPIALLRRELRAGATRVRNIVATLGLVVVAAALVACSAAAGNATTAPSIDPDALHISATNLEFSTATLTAPAGEPFQIVFDNQESAPHNVAIYGDAAATDAVFVEEPFGGPGVAVYDVPALEHGDYLFRCDVHPDMKGTLSAR